VKDHDLTFYSIQIGKNGSNNVQRKQVCSNQRGRIFLNFIYLPPLGLDKETQTLCY